MARLMTGRHCPERASDPVDPLEKICNADRNDKPDNWTDAESL